MIDYSKYIGFKDKTKSKDVLVDTQNRFLTQALFLETYKPELGYKPLYSMKPDENKVGLPSAREIYMTSVDEYDAMMKLVGNIDHWNRLTGVNAKGEYQCRWFMLGTDEFDGLLDWREEMRMRDECFAKAILQEQASNGSIPAAKALLELTKSKGSVGRPSNKVSQKENKTSITLKRMRELGVRVHESD